MSETENSKTFPIALKVKAKNGILQRFIDKRGWTQSDFARELELYPSEVGRWFNLQDYPHTAEKMAKVVHLVRRTEEEIFPNSIKSQDFMAIEKSATLYKEVPIEYLEYNKLSEIPYYPDFDDNIDRKKVIGEILMKLTSNEEQVIRLRFGLGGCEETYEEIGNIMGLSRERIRQIESKALRKLKHPSRVKALRVLVDENYRISNKALNLPTDFPPERWENEVEECFDKVDHKPKVDWKPVKEENIFYPYSLI